ncbi:uncharacterized protein EI90DRAFT_2057993 [Cantharellus anzutake]|uniref:uncharacterized protein n=1 Tax=Cantharellus anzutake TaxID=1750568 RepID=UPI001906AB67|nr:uncharacterized protein EI90DRAFT_2057993 [Cantharellus anzutake]KAF8340396.1 hypothetical protein EI90DRAFT_2057993 [Cantharellus anzutake]
MFCRLRRKKCKSGSRHGICHDCSRFHLKCDSRGLERPSWLKAPGTLDYVLACVRARTSQPEVYRNSPLLSLECLEKRAARVLHGTPSSPEIEPEGSPSDTESSSAYADGPDCTGTLLTPESNDFPLLISVDSNCPFTYLIYSI